MSTGYFDRDLELALQASSVEAEASACLLLGHQRSVHRRSLPGRQDKHAPDQFTDGTIFQIGTLNQFHSSLQNISREFCGPPAICGYLACAHVRLLEEYLSSQTGELSYENVQVICDILTNTKTVEEELRKAFVEIQDSRRAYAISSNATEAALDAALRQWVANYEISDYLSIHSRSDRTHFVRLNQWPARGAATPDVRQRLNEEERFGGRLLFEGQIAYSAHDSVYFIQTFRPRSVFLSPDEWSQASIGVTTSDPRPRLLVLDLNGHFAMAVACRLQLSPPAGCDGKVASAAPAEPTMLVFNTTSTDYLISSEVACAYDTVFPSP